MNEFCPALTSIYRDRRVLVTGHTGFKGSWLCTWLLELGARVAGLALTPDTNPNLFEALGLANRMASHICDIRDEAAVLGIFNSVRPEFVFHLAAQPLVRRSYAEPVATMAINVLGTAHVLEAARTTPGVRAVVAVTTDKVYADHETMRPYRELDPLGGLDPYSASKAAAELVAAAYQKNLCRGTVAIATARGGNVIGGGDWCEDRIVPDIVRAIEAGRPIVLRNPHAVRPWQHVLELCEAYLELGACLLEFEGKFAQAFNFGPDISERMTVVELTKSFLEAWGEPNHEIEVEESSLHETQVLRLDIAKALSLMSWRPRLDVHKALEWTASWYMRYHHNPLHAPILIHDQIYSFAKLMDATRKGI